MTPKTADIEMEGTPTSQGTSSSTGSSSIRTALVTPTPKNESSPLFSPLASTDVDDVDDDDDTTTSEYEYQLYPQRWFVLASFCVLNFSNGWIWVTWSPLTALVADFWGVSAGQVDALAGIYMYVFVPVNFVSMYLVSNYVGLATGLKIGAILNFLGTVVRCAGVSTLHSYEFVYAGTFLCALGQTFILPMLPLLSGSWYGAHERAEATGMGALSYQLGMLIALGATVVVDFRTDDMDDVSSTGERTSTMDGDKLNSYLQLQMAAAALALLMIFLNLTTERPPTPPSAAAANITGHGLDLHYLSSVQQIYQNPSSVAFFIVFGLSVGVFYALPTFLSQFVPAWSPSDQGLLGGIYQISAVTGCFAAGKIVDTFDQQYKPISLCLLACGIASVGGFMVAVGQQSHWAMIACGCVGFSFSAFMSVGIEFGTALTYPAQEAAVYGVLDSTAELTGFLLVTLGGSMGDSRMDFIAILFATVSIAIVILWFIRGEVKRPT
jgi:FLVCR family MFS transporter 7